MKVIDNYYAIMNDGTTKICSFVDKPENCGLFYKSSQGWLFMIAGTREAMIELYNNKADIENWLISDMYIGTPSDTDTLVLPNLKMYSKIENRKSISQYTNLSNYGEKPMQITKDLFEYFVVEDKYIQMQNGCIFVAQFHDDLLHKRGFVFSTEYGNYYYHGELDIFSAFPNDANVALRAKITELINENKNLIGLLRKIDRIIPYYINERED